ncbi:hypothetical protein HWV62_26110 [Athelia sp. TMB]|nr:hypothetical protein HWV62_26110 [Athelia sp. TMB]
MSSIGPALPPHLQPSTQADDDSDDEPGPSVAGPSAPAPVGPIVPAHLLSAAGPSQPPPTQNDDDEEDDDDYGPALPPELLAARAGPAEPASAPSKRVVGPSFPTRHDRYDDDSDDDVGPMPLPAGISFEEADGVREFMEREERRRKQIEEAAKPKKPQRDEWMLVPPSSSDLLGSLDPTKLKARQFARSAAPAKKVDNSLWTETPAERQQRLADEVSGRKRRAANAPAAEEEDGDAIKRRKLDAEIRRGVEEHTRKTRATALLDMHASGSKDKDAEQKAEGIWDRDRDMSLGGRLMDEKTRSKIVQDAKGLGDRFGAGKGGGYL